MSSSGGSEVTRRIYPPLSVTPTTETFDRRDASFDLLAGTVEDSHTHLTLPLPAASDDVPFDEREVDLVLRPVERHELGLRVDDDLALAAELPPRPALPKRHRHNPVDLDPLISRTVSKLLPGHRNIVIRTVNLLPLRPGE
jgi:hypothetical protein